MQSIHSVLPGNFRYNYASLLVVLLQYLFGFQTGTDDSIDDHLSADW